MTENLHDLLLRAQQGEKQANEQLVEENSGLIWSVVRRFYGRGVESDDLFQLGCIGFLKAIQGFDLAFGTEFSTYAVPKIAGEIRRFIRDDGVIKVSRTLKERSATIKMARQKLTGELGREPLLSELSDHLCLTAEEIATAETATSATESIQQPAGEDGFTLENVLSQGNMEERILELTSLRDAIKRLPQREQQVIYLRFFHGLTQERTAKIIHVSQVQVSRIERKALEQLRGII